jgi:hypothetical protein
MIFEEAKSIYLKKSIDGNGHNNYIVEYFLNIMYDIYNLYSESSNSNSNDVNNNDALLSSGLDSSYFEKEDYCVDDELSPEFLASLDKVEDIYSRPDSNNIVSEKKLLRSNENSILKFKFKNDEKGLNLNSNQLVIFHHVSIVIALLNSPILPSSLFVGFLDNSNSAVLSDHSNPISLKSVAAISNIIKNIFVFNSSNSIENINLFNIPYSLLFIRTFHALFFLIPSPLSLQSSSAHLSSIINSKIKDCIFFSNDLLIYKSIIISLYYVIMKHVNFASIELNFSLFKHNNIHFDVYLLDIHLDVFEFCQLLIYFLLYPATYFLFSEVEKFDNMDNLIIFSSSSSSSSSLPVISAFLSSVFSSFKSSLFILEVIQQLYPAMVFILISLLIYFSSGFNSSDDISSSFFSSISLVSRIIHPEIFDISYNSKSHICFWEFLNCLFFIFYLSPGCACVDEIPNVDLSPIFDKNISLIVIRIISYFLFNLQREYFHSTNSSSSLFHSFSFI